MAHFKRTKIIYDGKMFLVERQGSGVYECKREGGRKKIKVRVDEFSGAVFETERII